MSTTMPFAELGLDPRVLTALTALGYESPTPIQEKSIPILMTGSDLLAQAQTGTGKTAAFALPALSTLDTTIKQPQVLVVAPTRELAIQVSEAFRSYAKEIKGFHVLPIYGGQDYQIQLRGLKRGAQVIVGTPGRIMDHLRRGTLATDDIKTVVLDEADEMLKMGFIDDIKWIFEQIPGEYQTALFSATMPSAIQNIAKKYLKDPEKVLIKSTEKNTVDTIEQVYIRVAQNQKLDVLTRVLEVEDVTAAIIFSRTKTWSGELAEKLQARGYAAAALNGDMAQAQRQKTIERIKNGTLDIIVATDVAARGIDVERVSHVINYDIPHDSESYIHRIGRTGRAGRKGKALLLVTPREQRLLNDIERAIKRPIEQIDPPSLKEMNERRASQLAEKVMNVIEKSKKLAPYQQMVGELIKQSEADPVDIAAALAYLMQQSNPLPSHEIDSAEPRRGGGNRGHGDKRKPSRFKGKGKPSSDKKPYGKSYSKGKPAGKKKRPEKRD